MKGTPRVKGEISKRDFSREIGMDARLSKFITDFLADPQVYFQLSPDKRNKIEKQMDTILNKFN